MEDINILNIQGKDCYLVDSIENNGNVYHYFSNLKDENDVYVLKDKMVDGEECFVAVSQIELLDALNLFYEKHKDDNYEGATK